MEDRLAAHGQSADGRQEDGAIRADLATADDDDLAAADREIADLEARLRAAQAQRARATGLARGKQAPTALTAPTVSTMSTVSPGLLASPLQQQQHFLLLLSDSALPLGSFAFSSGLESFLAHAKHGSTTWPGHAASSSSSSSSRSFRGTDAFALAFLPLSVSSYASTGLPFVLAAHDAAVSSMSPSSSSSSSSSVPLADVLTDLDDTFDATIVCTVGRRASVAQGRALLSVWERALSPAAQSGQTTGSVTEKPSDPLRPFSLLVKRAAALSAASAGSSDLPPASAHLPPLFGAVAGLQGLDRRQTAHVFVLAHVKALASAAIRASLLGPFQAQKLLASGHVQRLVAAAVEREWAVPVAEAGQTAPVVDLWMGRHEMLYSRIFNS